MTACDMSIVDNYSKLLPGTWVRVRVRVEFTENNTERN